MVKKDMLNYMIASDGCVYYAMGGKIGKCENLDEFIKLNDSIRKEEKLKRTWFVVGNRMFKMNREDDIKEYLFENYQGQELIEEIKRYIKEKERCLE